MSERWLGLIASTDVVTIIEAEMPDDGPIVIKSDDTWRLQKGNRAAAYSVLHQLCSDYVKENGIDVVVVKASAVTGHGPARLGLLTGAEVRGVIMAAAGALCPVKLLSKALISRTFGERKVDEYVADDGFWATHTTGGALRKLSREAAMLLIAARNA
jgi:hypothetical protein